MPLLNARLALARLLHCPMRHAGGGGMQNRSPGLRVLSLQLVRREVCKVMRHILAWRVARTSSAVWSTLEQRFVF